jgi:hypothetical protein
MAAMKNEKLIAIKARSNPAPDWPDIFILTDRGSYRIELDAVHEQQAPVGLENYEPSVFLTSNGTPEISPNSFVGHVIKDVLTDSESLGILLDDGTSLSLVIEYDGGTPFDLGGGKLSESCHGLRMLPKERTDWQWYLKEGRIPEGLRDAPGF